MAKCENCAVILDDEDRHCSEHCRLCCLPEDRLLDEALAMSDRLDAAQDREARLEAALLEANASLVKHGLHLAIYNSGEWQLRDIGGSPWPAAGKLLATGSRRAALTQHRP